MAVRESGKASAALRRVTIAGALVCLLVATATASPLSIHDVADALQQPQDAAAQDLERLRAMLGQAGPDGRDVREMAVERLLGMADPAAHRVLQERLRQSDDPDGVRETILGSLQRMLLGSSSACFGGADEPMRRQIVIGYLSALVPLWREPGQAPDYDKDLPVRAAARLCLQRIPVRELDAAARVLLGSAEIERRVLLLRCLADMQQVLLAHTLADYVEAAEEPVRVQARRSLQLVTYHEEEFQTKAQFLAWYERNSTARYVDLAERAARLGPRPLERMREEIARLRVDAARDFVRALSVRSPGIDWATIQARTMVDDPAVFDACLDQLQQSLGNGLPVEDQAVPRQAFCRALLQRFHQIAADQVRRRANVLEVAAYLARPEELELATELTTLLLGQLDATNADSQIAALRGLRRFPSVETRTRLVRHAQKLLPAGAASQAQLLATLATLSSRSAPRWTAPAPGDADKGEWLALVAALCRVPDDADVRTAGLALAQALDTRDQRVPEAFGMLLELAKDSSMDPKFRSTCLIHLQGWRTQEIAAEGWVRAMHDLLADPAVELRQRAAESLARLPESIDPRRSEWVAATITVLQDRLLAEPTPTVLRALLDCLLACSREAQMPEKALGALNGVLGKLATPPRPENQFRVDPLLQALATIARDPHSDRGQWLSACKPLLIHEKRQSLRLVLQGHGAVDLAKSVDSTDSSLADRSRLAMQYVIKTALLKSPKEGWTSSEDLQREAFEVRIAFGALDTVEAVHRLDDPAHRVLRLEVDLALGKFPEVVQRATTWLSTGTGAAGPNGNEGAGRPETTRAQMTPVERDRIRILLAEAQLALGKPDVAARALTELRVEMSKDPVVLDFQSRIARALFATDPAAAVALFANAWQATAPEDPTFRQRLLDWMGYRLRHDPGSRADTLQQAAAHASLFERQDCPVEQREAFEQLRTAR